MEQTSLPSRSPEAQLDSILEAKREQLADVIQATRDKEKELRQADIVHRREMAAEFKERQKEYDTQIAVRSAELTKITMELDICQKELKAHGEHRADLLQSNRLREEKAKRLETDIHDAEVIIINYDGKLETLNAEVEGLLEKKRILLKEVEAIRTDKTTQLEVAAAELEDFKADMALEMVNLTEEVRDLKIAAARIKREIEEAKEADKERTAELRSAELSLSTKVKAFRDEQKEFQIEKRRFISGRNI